MRNRYFTNGETTTIILTSKNQIREAQIDTEDLQKVDSISGSWKLMNSRGGQYVAHVSRENGKRKWILLHRFILDCPKNLVVDHINRNTLDNRKCNIRIVTQAQNMQNRKFYKQNKTGARGVSFDQKSGKYRARVKVNGKDKSLGYFKTIEEATIAAINGRKRYMPYAADL